MSTSSPWRAYHSPVQSPVFSKLWSCLHDEILHGFSLKDVLHNPLDTNIIGLKFSCTWIRIKVTNYWHYYFRSDSHPPGIKTNFIHPYPNTEGLTTVNRPYIDNQKTLNPFQALMLMKTFKIWRDNFVYPLKWKHVCGGLWRKVNLECSWCHIPLSCILDYSSVCLLHMKRVFLPVLPLLVTLLLVMTVCWSFPDALKR